MNPSDTLVARLGAIRSRLRVLEDTAKSLSSDLQAVIDAAQASASGLGFFAAPKEHPLVLCCESGELVLGAELFMPVDIMRFRLGDFMSRHNIPRVNFSNEFLQEAYRRLGVSIEAGTRVFHGQALTTTWVMGLGLGPELDQEHPPAAWC